MDITINSEMKSYLTSLSAGIILTLVLTALYFSFYSASNFPITKARGKHRRNIEALLTRLDNCIHQTPEALANHREKLYGLAAAKEMETRFGRVFFIYSLLVTVFTAGSVSYFLLHEVDLLLLIYVCFAFFIIFYLVGIVKIFDYFNPRPRSLQLARRALQNLDDETYKLGLLKRKVRLRRYPDFDVATLLARVPELVAREALREGFPRLAEEKIVKVHKICGQVECEYLKYRSSKSNEQSKESLVVAIYNLIDVLMQIAPIASSETETRENRESAAYTIRKIKLVDRTIRLVPALLVLISLVTSFAIFTSSELDGFAEIIRQGTAYALSVTGPIIAIISVTMNRNRPKQSLAASAEYLLDRLREESRKQNTDTR